jgi:hypothetical protein
MAAGLRLDAALADRIVAARQIKGGFRDLDDLVATAGLQPHELIKIRGKVIFGPAQAAPRLPTQQGRANTWRAVTLRPAQRPCWQPPICWSTARISRISPISRGHGSAQRTSGSTSSPTATGTWRRS